MSEKTKLNGRHIHIRTLSPFVKEISVCGVVVARVDWTDESDGKLTVATVVSDILPASCTYFEGRKSNTNARGYVDIGSSSVVLTGEQIENGEEPPFFHPVRKLEINTPDHGKWKTIQVTKMDGTWAGEI